MQAQPSNLAEWQMVCRAEDIEQEGIMRFDSAGRTFAVYRTFDDQFFATDGLCTHEKVHLADGYLEDEIVECPKHSGRFDITNGRAVGAPVCINLKTYDVKNEDGSIYILID